MVWLDGQGPGRKVETWGQGNVAKYVYRLIQMGKKKKKKKKREKKKKKKKKSEDICVPCESSPKDDFNRGRFLHSRGQDDPFCG